MTGLGKRDDYTAVRMQYIRFFYRLKKFSLKEKLIQMLILTLLLDKKYITSFNDITTIFNGFHVLRLLLLTHCVNLKANFISRMSWHWPDQKSFDSLSAHHGVDIFIKIGKVYESA